MSNGLHIDVSLSVKKQNDVQDIILRYVGFVVQGESPGCRLIGTASMLGVVEEPPPPPLTREQYGKMESKYPGGCHCQSVLRHQGFFNVSPLF